MATLVLAGGHLGEWSFLNAYPSAVQKDTSYTTTTG